MIVEGFDNAWHILSHWTREGYTHFLLAAEGKVPFPQQCHDGDIPSEAVAGVDYFPIPTLEAPIAGDNPTPERNLTAAEIILAAAIAEGWEPSMDTERGMINDE